MKDTIRTRFKVRDEASYPPPRCLISHCSLLSFSPLESFLNFLPASPDAKYSVISSASGIIALLAFNNFPFQMRDVGVEGFTSLRRAPAKKSLMTSLLRTLMSPAHNLLVFPLMTLRAFAFARSFSSVYCVWRSVLGSREPTNHNLSRISAPMSENNVPFASTFSYQPDPRSIRSHVSFLDAFRLALRILVSIGRRTILAVAQFAGT